MQTSSRLLKHYSYLTTTPEEKVAIVRASVRPYMSQQALADMVAGRVVRA